MEPPHKKLRVNSLQYVLLRPDSPRPSPSTRNQRPAISATQSTSQTTTSTKRLPKPFSSDRLLRPRPTAPTSQEPSPRYIPPCPLLRLLAPKPEPARPEFPRPPQSVSRLVTSTFHLNVHPVTNWKQLFPHPGTPRPSTIQPTYPTLTKKKLCFDTTSSRLNLAYPHPPQRHSTVYPPGYLANSKKVFEKKFELDIGQPALPVEGGYSGMSSHVETKVGGVRYLLGRGTWVDKYKSGMGEGEELIREKLRWERGGICWELWGGRGRRGRGSS